MPCSRRQGGQALMEALIIMVVLASLWLGIAWLGRLQDIGLQLTHASRRAAFAHAHQGLALQTLEAGGDGYLDAPGQRWQTRKGENFLLGEAGLSLRSLGALRSRQPGDPHAWAADLRRELQLGDPDLWRVEAHAETAGRATPQGTLSDFDTQRMRLQRHTAIQSGDGAAASDTGTQAILEGSSRAWGDAAAASRTAGEWTLARLRGVDAAWGRALPQWDWIRAWAGSVPRTHLHPWRQP